MTERFFTQDLGSEPGSKAIYHGGKRRDTEEVKGISTQGILVK